MQDAREQDQSDQGFACYVINLDGSTERLAGIRARLDATAIRYERQSAVDGRAFGAGDVPEYDEAAALRYMGRKLVGGELGCYLSHLKTAQRFLQTEADACLVLEDDAVPVADLDKLVRETCAQLRARDPDWRIVNLGNPRQKITREVAQITVTNQPYSLARAYYFPMTTSAILWSRKGAAEFVAEHRTIFAPVDNYLRHWITRAGGGYAFEPRPVSTLEAGSDIGGATGPRRARHGRSVAYGWRKQRRLLIDKAIAMLTRMRA